MPKVSGCSRRRSRFTFVTVKPAGESSSCATLPVRDETEAGSTRKIKLSNFISTSDLCAVKITLTALTYKDFRRRAKRSVVPESSVAEFLNAIGLEIVPF
jgi:hypothetical protein